MRDLPASTRTWPRLTGRIVLALVVTTVAACAGSAQSPAARQRPTTTAGPVTSAATAPGAAPATPGRDAPSPSRSTTAPVTATPARVDGTVSPLNAGATEPVVLKSSPDPLTGTALLRDVRIGVHPEEGGWDRIVFEFGDTAPGGSVRYVTTVAACGSGAPVAVRGGAVLAVRFSPADAHDAAGRQTIARAALTGPGSTILEARQICDFEAVIEWAVGVKGVQRFKVTRLSNPERVVIDIKH